MRSNLLVVGALSLGIFADHVISENLSSIEELQQVMEFDQACIIMHEVGTRYLDDEDKITQSYRASEIIEEHLEAKILEYTATTGDSIEDVRNSIFEKGVVIFNELSKHQPRDLVYQCKQLLEEIKKSNLKYQTANN